MSHALFPGDHGVTLFPKPQDILSAEQPWLADAVDPLVTLDPAQLPDGALTPDTVKALSPMGPLTIINPIEPEFGVLGEEIEFEPHDLTALNWLCFTRDAHGRYVFPGDPEFLMPCREHVEQARAQFNGSRHRFAEHGELTFGDRDDPTQVRAGWGRNLPAVDRVGGSPGFGNWTEFPPPPALALDLTGTTPQLTVAATGQPFYFVAATAGYPWRDEGPDAILLFAEPDSDTIALTFDWS